MARPRKSVSGRGPRILLSNDDGINAPGLKCLERIAREISDDVWVVAPETEQSGASHSLTLHTPLRLRRINPRKYAVMGTPTDCVVLAVAEILKENRPDLLLSGVNRGSNIADDVTYSGTIAAAMEGTVLGIPSIALSQTYGFQDGGKINWGVAEKMAPAILRRLLKEGWPGDVLININFPDPPPGHSPAIEITGQGRRDQSLLEIEARTDRRGVPYYWTGFQRIRSNPAAGTDLHAIYAGNISITPLHLNLTHERTLRAIRKAFEI
ncbi:MAG TPA: 5'/3'-nucleotidase SurE [Alphaproteobacteria bacterium]|jgi:5'-nucleotidase|nr:5'/3'-nucleotidase SurE [Alphaproteobacteria bacterium]